MYIIQQKAFLVFLFLLLATGISYTQTDFVNTKSAKESLKFAQDYYSKGALQKARRQLEHTLKIKSNFAVAHRLLGKVYFDLKEYPKAIAAYEASFELNDKLSRAAFFECAEAYLLEEQTDMAHHYFQQFKEMKGKRYANVEKEGALEIEYDNLLYVKEQNLLFISQIDSSNVSVDLQLLSKAINSKHDEYLPSITSDGNFLLFTRNIKNKDENILLSTFKNTDWTDAHPMSGELNTEHNEGMAKFEAVNNVFYFAGCNRAEQEGCDIYRAAFEQGKVTDISSLEGRINSYYWDSQPSVTCDGHTMYFASTREGGFGGADIWQCQRNAAGEWGVPVNMGPNINTPSDEEAPFIATDGVTLYFTSDGHLGMGNGDIFVSYFENNTWTMPDNLGVPINSTAKELGIYVQGDHQTAYFASARKGGLGGLDIYKVMLPDLYQPAPMVQIRGEVYDETTGEPIQVEIKLGNNGNNWTIQSNADGSFFQCLAGDKGYSLQVHKKGYAPYIDAMYLTQQDNRSKYGITIPLVPEKTNTTKETSQAATRRLTKTVIQIYFEFDSAIIAKDEFPKLDKVADLMNTYDDWSVQVVGFADNIGDENYNKQLSQQRADEVVRFLQQKSSVEVSAIVDVIGKGTAENLGSEEARKKSRRVDVVLTR